MKLGLCALFMIGISAQAAEPIMVYGFVNSTCPISKAHEKPWEELRQEFQSKEFSFVKIETPLYPADRGKTSHVNITLIRRFNVRSVPAFVVVKSGETTKYFGLFSENPLQPKSGQQYLREAVVSLVNGESVKQPTTRPRGCAVPEWVFNGK